MIKPSIGRKVWYHPSEADLLAHGGHLGDEQPFDATVVYVHDERSVNLRVTGHDGTTYTVLRAPLLQEGDQPLSPGYAEWMPYQVGQARTQTGIQPGEKRG